MTVSRVAGEHGVAGRAWGGGFSSGRDAPPVWLITAKPWHSLAQEP